MKRYCHWIVLLGLATPASADPVEIVAGKEKGELLTPFGCDFTPRGLLIVAEYDGQRVRQVDKGVVTTLAGSGKKGNGGDGGPALQCEFNAMHNLAVAPNGDIYVADTNNNKVRKIDAKTGIVSTFAGTAVKGFSGDGGPADKAQFGAIYCATFDFKGEKLYLADLDNRRIRVVDMKSGIVTTVAGNGKKGVPEDGADAVAAPLVDPRAVAVDRKGNIYIVERGGHALRVVDSQGKIRTVAGTGKAGYSGDGGPAREAALNGPKHLAIDLNDNVLIVDTENHVIRRYLPSTGKIVRVAGTGKKGSAGVGGPADQCELSRPHGVTVNRSGDIYIADSDNDRVLRIRNE